jgi:hypothetical protein
VGHQRRDQSARDDPLARYRAAAQSRSAVAATDVIPRAFFANLFKIPTLWGVKDTAPYFTTTAPRRSATPFSHYQRFFNFTEAQDRVGSRTLGGFIVLTDQGRR